ncbi:MAG: hypothetical protein ABIO94_06225 [Opitutaceae bacterium]
MTNRVFISRSPAARDDEAIQLDRDECDSLGGDECLASAATARFAHLAMTQQTHYHRAAVLCRTRFALFFGATS